MKKILIDIKHPAQLNLFKGLAKELKTEGWDVTISYLDRGKLTSIINREYQDFDKKIGIGKSVGTKWSIFWNGNVVRTLDFFKLIFRERYDITVAASSIPLAYASYFTSTPIIQFYDDAERKSVNRINSFFSTRLFFPPIVETSRKVETFNCLKEWSYLSPARFTPNKQILHEYGLKEHDYLFIREVSNKSFNYYSQEDAVVCSFADRITKGIKIVLSLEDKGLSKKYPADWIILKEPVSDIHSIIYYSKLMVSSGDSMAREGAMLGVPSIYCGVREMKANNVLIDEGLLQHKPLDASASTINELLEQPFNEIHQIESRNRLKEKWDDMIHFMKDKIAQYQKNGTT